MSTVHSVRNVVATHQEIDDPHVTVVPEFVSIYLFYLYSNPPSTPCVPKVPVRNCRTLLPVFKAVGTLVIDDREQARLAVLSTNERYERAPHLLLVIRSV